MDGNVVLITGAAGNLGRVVVAELAQTGAKMVWVERDGTALDKLADTLPATVEVLKLGGIDLTNIDACRKAIQDTLEAYGRIDALVNTVGGFQMGPVDEEGIALWDRLFNLNAHTAYAISAAVLKPMQAAGYGRIVHIAAAPGLKAGANQSAYAASKGAVIRLTEAIAAENRDKRITANCILPGTIDTPQNRAAMPNAKTESWVTPQSIAQLITFLISPAAAVVTGAAIPATGKA
jgi:NAD(P)-dependent dehydrogenase (short-subunit alcohol dehydrogenase family)